MGGFIPGEEIKIIQPGSLCPETLDVLRELRAANPSCSPEGHVGNRVWGWQDKPSLGTGVNLHTQK